MLSYDQIRDFQAAAAAAAAKTKMQPYLAEADDVGNVDRIRYIPSIGDYLPSGWRRVEPSEIGPNRSRPVAGTVGHNSGVPGDREVSKYFVDSSGFGSPGEPALTVQEFADLIRPGYGYAIVEEGQFQVGIGVFKKV